MAEPDPCKLLDSKSAEGSGVYPANAGAGLARVRSCDPLRKGGVVNGIWPRAGSRSLLAGDDARLRRPGAICAISGSFPCGTADSFRSVTDIRVFESARGHA